MTHDMNDKRLTQGETAFKKSAIPLFHLSRLVAVLLVMIGAQSVWGQTDITSLSDITNDPTGHYRLTSDVSGSGHTSIETFSGTLEAAIDPNTKMPYRITGLNAPLFTTLTGTVKNLVLEGVSISSGDNDGNTGAIACTANSAARIYNIGILSGSVGGTGDTGGLVGALSGTARVVNCYSFADISSGNNVGGIVGNNKETTNSDAANLKTMVMNCMFYGDITGGTKKSPIYGGTIINNKDNKGVGNYNYFRLEAPYVQPTGITYNCALGAEERFLQRFEFYRHLLNGHRELAGWWATGTYSSSEMLKWVFEPSQIGSDTPYPILKAPGKYPSVVNIDAENATTQSERNKGGKLGTLTVNIQMGDGAVFQRPTGAAITTSQLTLNITDKDPSHYNFNYYKVQLPYYNDVGSNNYNGNRVVTGWKIVSITGGTAGTYSTGEDVTYTDGVLTATPYNFADRNCTNKDLYSVSGRVFNQGAYWDVPYGVTSITIEPYWAKCVYLADAYADVVYNTNMGTAYNVSNVGGGQKYTNRNSYTIAGESQMVFTSKGDAIATSNSGLFQGASGSGSHTVYDYAVVLVGNYHFYGNLDADMSKPYTVTSIDLDGDNEPDYSYILRFDSRKKLHPVRVDFINIPGLGMAQKSTGGTGSYNFGIMQPLGWFESTNTSLFRETQFEYDNSTRVAAPYILQGGVMEQWVNGQSADHANKTTYFHVGGNVWFKEFHRGTHQDNTYDANHSPVSVTGGDFDQFHLTGLYRADVTIRDDNAECYITGGRFGVVAGTGMDGIGHPTNHTNGNITWIIDNADIKEFYAGSFNADKPAQGNLHTIVNGGHIELFCGGPKFGDMNPGRTVTTTATGCTFGTFFGAGYGGNSYSRQAPRNHNSVTNFPHNDNQAGNDASWNAWLKRFYKQTYDASFGGVSTQFNYQFIPMSGNTTNVARIFVEYVKFSLATTRNVTSNLTNCHITGNFYGGGSLGKVDGDVTSTLASCTVNGSVFGSGFSASIPTVEVDSIGFRIEPLYYTELGTYRNGIKGQTTTYHWEHGSAISVDNTNHILYTPEDLNTLGTVSGDVILNITGNTLVEGKVFDGDGNIIEQTGGVFGGGDESKVTGANKTVTVNINQTGGSATHYLNNVFGGGNKGDVASNVQVTVQGTSYVSNNVFGGGNLADVGGSVTVNMSSGTVVKDVYGGGALANTNISNVTAGYGTGSETIPNTTTKTTAVNLTGGTIQGDAYGGGLGRIGVTAVTGVHFTQEEINAASEGDPAYHKTTDDWKVEPVEGVEAVKALVYGNVTVTQNGTAFVPATRTDDAGNTVVKAGRIFGCNNLNGSPQGTVLVLVTKTVRADGNPHAKSVYDANGNLTTNNYEMNAVYGGGNLAAYNPLTATLTATGQFTQYTNASNLTVTRELTNNPLQVVINGCSDVSIEYVYGGGNAAPTPSTDVLILGAFEIGYTFGGGNGKDKYTIDGGAHWNTNPGADVGIIDATAYAADHSNGTYGSGDANTAIYGGTIHEVYGASNQKGNIAGDINLDVKEGETSCTLKVGKIVGAGKNADIDGDVILVMGCMPTTKTPLVFGGADNANVNGNVELTITSGTFGKVFGGNNLGGIIKGHLKVNIEETGCNPIKIDELYLGGNEAAYSRYGYYDSGTFDSYGRPIYNPISADDNTHTAVTGIHNAPYAEPVLNVISCTYIGSVFGGGLGSGAVMYADPTVNINMVQGAFANALPVDADNNPNKLGAVENVYGGGNEAAVYGNTTVNIGTLVNQDIVLISPENETEANRTKQVLGAFITGTVYGAGKGLASDPNAAIVTGNTQVNMAGGHVSRSIYGGGELSSVGTFTETYAAISGNATDGDYHVKGEPKTCAENTGKTEVIVTGGQVGLVNQLMPDPSRPTSDDDYGYIFCAGKGMADPTDTNSDGVPYANLLAVSGSSHLEISGGLVAASVYGGSENGQVLGNTHVEIMGGQIGSGHYKDASDVDHWDPAYTESQWTAAINAIKSGVVGDINTAVAPFHECDAWPFGAEGSRYVYDYYHGTPGYDSQGGGKPGSDGHSYYGNVFGGGSGYYPYGPGLWRRTAGRVIGNTLVEITGGHILTNVYGGNEITDVLGQSKVVMKAGTVGVPRTIAGIQARPVNSYIFGAGMGDPRVLFNGWSNVASAEVIVDSVAVVFGSVFGGGEDGHVLGDVSTTIKGDALIGTFGSSGVDGNIFGSGRGFSTLALTAGAVCGNVSVNISENAKILGSIFGGGRMAAVGTYLVGDDDSNYGKLIAEGQDPYGTGSNTHGNVTINITGGTIGNLSQLSNHQFSVGDVFGGSKGVYINDEWTKSQKLGLVKNTTVNISQATGYTTRIYGNVYGGGEIASVGSYKYAEAGDVTTYNATHPTEPLTVGDVYQLLEENTGKATILIKGGTIGQPDPSDAHGHVFGGCLGMAGTDYSGYSFVNESVVTLENGTVYGSIFGGGENGHVLDDTNVNIMGGSVGIRLDNLTGTIPETAIYRGNVYGGGRGIDTYNNNGTNSYSITAGKVSGHTTVTVTGGQIYRNVYGGGSLASVGDPDENSGGLASVSITGGKIGTDGGYHGGSFEHLLENGHVFGSGRGVAGGSNDDFIRLAYVKNTEVTIGGTAYVTGSVFGSGENGHVRKNTTVTVNAGTGYSHEQAPTTEDIEPYPVIGYPLTQAEMVETPTSPVMIYRGNVYGGGRGIDHTTSGHLSETAGAVKGNTTVNINGGTIRHNVYGGGSLASTGNITDENGVIVYHDVDGNPTGEATVNIRGGLIGMSPLLDICKNGGDTYSGLNNGQVYGGARGVAAVPGQTAGSVASEYVLMAYVHDTQVNVNGTAKVFGSVFGGGANGHVSRNTVVNVSGGEIGTNPSVIGATSNYYFMNPETGIDGHVIFTGNVYGGGRGLDRNEEGDLSPTAGRVYGNTKVNITGGQIYHNVYGGGSLASVGTFTKSGTTYTWTENTGKSEVIISGGTVGFEDFSMDDYLSYMSSHPGTDPSTIFGNFTNFKFNTGRVFGSGRGKAGAEYTEYAYVRDAYVTIQGTGAVKGNVFGSGENGHVKRNTYVEIKGGEVGYKVPSLFLGNVYGGGRGVDLYNDAVSVTAGLTEGNSNVTVSGGKIYRDVYGGGSLASVGQAADSSTGLATVTIETGGTIGDDFCVANGFGGNVFGSGRGMVKKATGPDYSQMAYVNKTEVIVKGHVMGNVYGGGNAGHVRNNTHVQILNGALVGTNYGGNVYYGNVFGAGKGTSKTGDYSATAGAVLGSVVVDMLGGTVLNDVYGGAALANSNIGNATNYGTASEAISATSTNTTTVNLVGGTLKNAYGGGQGDSETAAIVYGDASVLLNGSTASGAANNCKVRGNIFGGNNINGTPKGHALVHVYKTEGYDDTHKKSTSKDNTTYDVAVVYGGGNMAAYEPVSNDDFAEVIIDGCDLTSIAYVYGGGNAASVPAAEVMVNGTYEIGAVFGGGNGKDALPNGEDNPGAHVGLMAYPNAAGDAYSTKAERAANYGYGTGKAHVTVYGGTVHEVYGGSNTKGNVRVEARTTLEDQELCEFDLGEAYGGGRNAEMDGDAVLEVGCIKGLGRAYGGAANADVNGDVVLNITNGTYGQVFGGNDMGGNISGSITVNIEETGCRPIIIGELYGGGNEAAYTAPTGGNYPEVNIKSFTSIGTVFGGGYGEAAVITGNPEVNINVVTGKYKETVVGEGAKVVGSSLKNPGDSGYDASTGFSIPAHQAGTIGNIGTVFGGGNAARVVGNTNVNVGTHVDEEVYDVVTVATGASVTSYFTRSGDTYTAATGMAVDGTTYYEKKKVAVRIVGNVFGGGNKAEVTGNTNVIVGK